MLLSIEHVTTYRYSRPVTLGTHRLVVRPMEGHDVQIRSSTLAIEPAHRIRWIHDIFGNSIALVDFLDVSSRLRIESRVTVEQYNTNPFDFVLEPYVSEAPFRYREEEGPDIAPYLNRRNPEDEEAVRSWMRPFLDIHGRARTLDFLIAVNKAVPHFFEYRRREEPGVQTPGQTLNQRAGSCRDFALLLMETARCLGMAARFVSGYLCGSGSGPHEAARGATHACVEVYLPGAGWKGFDPTCGIMAADLHVRVAVARDPTQAVPISGTFSGDGASCVEMEVFVKGESIAQPATAAAGR